MMNAETVWQPSAPLCEQVASIQTDLLLLASSEESEGAETCDQLERLRTELGGLGVTPIVWDCLGRRRDIGSSALPFFDRALALRGFEWGKRFDHSWRSKRGIVLGGGASLGDKLAVKAGIEAAIGVHGLIAFYVADDPEGDISYVGADGDLALFSEIANLRGTGRDHTVNHYSSASIQVEQSSGILETPALAAEIAIATARVLHALMP